MEKVKIIEVKQSIFAANNQEAEETRRRLKEQKTFMINLMASPGAGKTTLLCRTIEALKDEMKIGVMEADIDASVDAESIQAAGARSIQLHTGGMCHMDSSMTKQGLDAFETESLDLLFLENIGNLVCPAEFDTGASINVALLSVPEGDDKPLKYPLMFQVCDLVMISKMDVKPVFDFDTEKVVQNIRMRNPNAEVIFLSAKTGENMDQWYDWLRRHVKAWQA